LGRRIARIRLPIKNRYIWFSDIVLAEVPLSHRLDAIGRSFLPSREEACHNTRGV
jgi:hypothetical protein